MALHDDKHDAYQRMANNKRDNDTAQGREVGACLDGVCYIQLELTASFL